MEIGSRARRGSNAPLSFSVTSVSYAIGGTLPAPPANWPPPVARIALGSCLMPTVSTLGARDCSLGPPLGAGRAGPVQATTRGSATRAAKMLFDVIILASPLISPAC